MDFERYGDDVKKLHEEYTAYIISADPRVTRVLRQMLKRALEIGDPMLTGFVYHAKAYVAYYITGNYGAFLKNLRLSSRYLVTCEDKSEMKNVYYMITLDALNKGLPDIAHYYAIQAQNVALETGQTDAASIIEGMIAVLMMRMGDYEAAYASIQKSLKGIQENKAHPMFHLNLLITYIDEGSVLLGLEKTDRAEERYADALQYMASCGQTIETDAKINLEILGVRIALKKEDARLMRERFLRLMQLMEDAVHILDHITNLQQIQEALLAREHYQESEELLEAVERFHIPGDAPDARRAVLEMRIDHFRALGEENALSDAYEVYEREQLRLRNVQRNNHMFVKDLIRLADELKQEQILSREENVLIRQKAHTDALCQIPNRHALNTRFEQLYERAYRERTALGVCLMDVDGLKEYNDSHGHAAGDTCLKQIGKVLKRVSEKDGIFAARYGGDEFVLIYENRTDEEIRKSLAKIGKRMPLRVSTGIYNEVPDSTHRSWDFLARADRDLYRVKKEKPQTGIRKEETT